MNAAHSALQIAVGTLPSGHGKCRRYRPGGGRSLRGWGKERVGGVDRLWTRVMMKIILSNPFRLDI